MTNKLLTCPISGNTCAADGCMWWDSEWKDCSVPILVKYLRAADVRATFDHNVPAEFLEGQRK